MPRFTSIIGNVLNSRFFLQPYIQATGGSVSYSGKNKIHTFSTTGTFTFTVNWQGATSSGSGIGPNIMNTLVVAGGGSGGGYGSAGGGGGGGGVLLSSTTTMTIQTYTITVGAGGQSTSSIRPLGTNGDNSSIVGTDLSIISIGGGCGGPAGGSGSNGGSGGGGGSSGSPGIGVFLGSSYLSQARQGYTGGTGDTNGGGGGGGAAASNNGQYGSGGSPQGQGGSGVSSSISGSLKYYGGGGGGVNLNNILQIPGSGVTGGGGNGLGYNGDNPAANVSVGTPNTGGGGGGGGYQGGSGIVIISYQYIP